MYSTYSSQSAFSETASPNSKVNQYSVRLGVDEENIASRKYNGFLGVSYFFDFALISTIINVRSTGKYCVLLPLLLLACSLAIGLSLVQYGADANDSFTISRTRIQAQNMAHSFELTVRKAFIPLYALRSVILSDTNGTSLLPKFDTISDELIQSSGGIVANLGMAPNGINIIKYPLKGNEKSIGHNLFAANPGKGIFNGTIFTYPSRKTDSYNAVKYGDIYVTGPRNLVQGYTAVLGTH